MFLWIAAKKLCLWSFYTLATLGVTGTSYQYISTKLDERRYPAPGKMIDIDGYRLHIQESGMEHSGPTIILDAGAGNYSLDWTLVQPAIAQFAHVISYDRAGDGWSDESPLPRTSKNMMIELHTLLQKAGIPGPYIFVGHSFGGLNAQIYAHLHPDEIAGIILVDSSHEEQDQWLPKPPASYGSSAMKYVALTAAYAGIIRLALNFSSQINHLPAHLEKIRRTHICRPQFIRTAFAMTQLFDESNKQLKELDIGLGAIPLTVITAGKPVTMEQTGGMYTQEQLDAMFNTWQELQKDLATRSSNSKHMIAQNSGHMITDEQPEIIVEAVREMLQQYKKEKVKMNSIEKQAGQQLIDAAKRDMQIRTELLESGELMKMEYHPRMEQCHVENAALLEQFLDAYGWPTPSKWGKEVHEAAWLIGIHAIGQPKVLKRVFHFIETLWQAKEIDGGEYARLYDRIALYEGRKQKYGTQLWTSPRGWYAPDLENPGKVNEYRKAVGLETLEEWIKEASEGDFNGFTEDYQSPHDEKFVAWLKSCGWRK